MKRTGLTTILAVLFSASFIFLLLFTVYSAGNKMRGEEKINIDEEEVVPPADSRTDEGFPVVFTMQGTTPPVDDLSEILESIKSWSSLSNNGIEELTNSSVCTYILTETESATSTDEELDMPDGHLVEGKHRSGGNSEDPSDFEELVEGNLSLPVSLSLTENRPVQAEEDMKSGNSTPDFVRINVIMESEVN